MPAKRSLCYWLSRAGQGCVGVLVQSYDRAFCPQALDLGGPFGPSRCRVYRRISLPDRGLPLWLAWCVLDAFVRVEGGREQHGLQKPCVSRSTAMPQSPPRRTISLFGARSVRACSTSAWTLMRLLMSRYPGYSVTYLAGTTDGSSLAMACAQGFATFAGVALYLTPVFGVCNETAAHRPEMPKMPMCSFKSCSQETAICSGGPSLTSTTVSIYQYCQRAFRPHGPHDLCSRFFRIGTLQRNGYQSSATIILAPKPAADRVG